MTDQIARSQTKLWNRDFSTLWWSEAVSFFGSQLTLFAIPIVALQILDSSASDVAWINMAAGLGTVVFLGLLGPWTDKVRRTRFMSLMSGLRALVLSTMAVLFLMGNLSLLALVIAAFLVSGLTGLYDSAFAALLPSVAHRSKLTTHALRTGSMTPAEIGIAGAVGGIISLLSMMAAPWVWDRFRPVRALMATFMLPALAGLGMLLLTPGQDVANVLLLGLSLGFWASCVMVNITGTETLKQLLIPHEALGRFSSASRVLTWGIDPIGAALAGVLALFLPTGAVLAAASSGVVISACWIAASGAVRELPLLSEIEPRPE
ncbi:hypothetical protein [Arthrobacter sp. efr-133-TYG-118]|uniref:hypothetical protein n=1 Tax=Arthrobacter sp. efr-133-TYG-118 TaxID=3040279 RepID=UPI00254F1236|nr:hypothetical protein [Arthrobacter sp. efr-133-TYG-118]